MKEKSHKTSIVLLLICTILFTLFEPFGMTNIYASVNRSISSDSDKTAKIDGDGNLKFSVKAVGASSGTRWKTVGLYVTSDPTGRNGKESTKAKDCVFFDKLPKGCSKTDITVGKTVTTTFTISKEVFNSMCDKAGVNLKTLQKNGGKVYIQGVLQGYSISKGGSKRNVTERCYTYKQMSNTRNTRRVNGSTWYGIGWPAVTKAGGHGMILRLSTRRSKHRLLSIITKVMRANGNWFYLSQTQMMEKLKRTLPQET